MKKSRCSIPTALRPPELPVPSFPPPPPKATHNRENCVSAFPIPPDSRFDPKPLPKAPPASARRQQHGDCSGHAPRGATFFDGTIPESEPHLSQRSSLRRTTKSTSKSSQRWSPGSGETRRHSRTQLHRHAHYISFRSGKLIDRTTLQYRLDADTIDNWPTCGKQWSQFNSSCAHVILAGSPGRRHQYETSHHPVPTLHRSSRRRGVSRHSACRDCPLLCVFPRLRGIQSPRMRNE